jgi:two-component system OmpR family sensor kinase
LSRGRWPILLTPALLGIGLALFFFLYYDESHAHVVYLRADLGTLSLLLGLLLTLIIALTFSLLAWRDRVQLHASEAAAQEHRRFLSRLDHELKNPLTAIRAGLANLAEPSGNPANPETLASLEAQVLRMSRLSSDLRKLAEIEVRQVECLPVDLPSLLQEAFQLAQEQPGASDRTLNLSLPRVPWPLPTTQGDADLLFMAVYNLLENALKFSRPGDMVELRAFEDGPEVVIEVADTGPGIPDEEQPLVWGELYRGKAGRGIPGSGLGLALVHAVMDRHGGRVGLRSRVDRGTVFILRLPAR